MQTIKTIKHLQKLLNSERKKGKSIGFVPTMGAFHEGHLSLMHRSVKKHDVTVVSLFVNPTQFGKNEDLSKYPRNLKRDKAMAKAQNVDYLFIPTAEEMYPKDAATEVSVKNLDKFLCGKSRPGHFKGVCTIVSKLINIVNPDVMYFGQKDYQQVRIIQQMVKDLDFLVGVKTCPTVRESDGLAMSSRNQYLSLQQRQESVLLYKALREAKRAVLDGEKSATNIIKKIKVLLNKKTKSRIDYIAVVDAKSLTPVRAIKGKVVIALAVWFGKTRLIDNILI